MTGSTNYAPTGRIGQNNCVVLYEGYDKSSDRDVIIMELQQQFRAEDGAARPTAWRDVERAIKAPLENTVERLSLVKETGWIVVQKLHASLAEHKEASRGLDPDLVRSAIRRSLEALRSYEAAGIMHGCVKPGNLVHFDQDFVKLNFSPGMKLGEQIAQPCCDYRYIAPEIITPEFGEVGPASDLYALGITALELLLGNSFAKKIPDVGPLSRDSDDVAWLRWHTSEETVIPPLLEIMPDAPPDLAQVIDQLVKKHVSERYEVAQDALDDLDDPDVAPDVRVDAVKVPKKPQPRNTGHVPVPTQTSSSPDDWKARLSKQWDKLVEQARDPKNRPYLIGSAVVLFILAFISLAGENKMEVTFTTEPEGAELVLNNQPTGGFQTPVTITIPVGGPYDVKFLLDGYETYDTQLTVESGKENAVTHTFRTLAIPVTITSKTEGVTVEITSMENGYTGKTPATVELRPGLYQLALTADGYEPGQETVEVPSGVESYTAGPFELKPDITLPEGLIACDDAELHPELKLPTCAYAEKTDSSDQRLEFVLIEPGSFVYGVPDGARFEGELAARQVSVDTAFYISVTEVSNAQFALFQEPAGGSANASTDDASLPVTSVSHDDAGGFCRWISPLGTLPSEVEWELAAGGPKSARRQTPWDPTIAAPDPTICNFVFDPASSTQLNDVAALPEGRTANGLMNMLGNAAEWCRERYEAGYSAENGEQTGDPGVDVWPAIRGGSYRDYIETPEQARITMRANHRPEGGPDVGFRVVVTAQ